MAHATLERTEEAATRPAFGRRERTLHAAERVLTIVFEHFSIGSVVDFGCGTGTWLTWARQLGAPDVLGYEASRRAADSFDEPDLLIEIVDLEQRVNPNRRFDLAISLEVGEHLSRGRSETFVADLCRASDRVLFSAAIPGQGGLDHVNERWQSSWAALFAVQGYQPLDLVRPRIWDDEAIPIWYRQNILLYLSRDEYQGFLTRAVPGVLARLQHVDLVHPGTYIQRRRLNLSGLFRTAMQNPRAFVQAAHRRLSA
jgi:hypothetical protein